MSDYTTSHCPVCEERFTKQDDIVVCPVCGTPYHRTCYQKAGSCVNIQLHAENKSWTPKQEDENLEKKLDGTGSRRCTRCGMVNPPETVYCQICGNKLEENPQNAAGYRTPGYSGPTPIPVNPFTTPFGGVSADDTINGIPLREVALYVGESSHYFLPRFKAFEKGHVVSNWNWPALLFHFLYFFYRKMYKLGFLLLGIELLLSIPGIIVSYQYGIQMLENMQSSQLFSFDTAGLETIIRLSYVGEFLTFAVRMFFSLRFNRFYCAHVCRQIKKLSGRFEDHTSQEYALTLSKRGRTNKLILILVILGYFAYLASYMMLQNGGLF